MFKLALNAGHGIYTKGKRCLKSLDPNETREWELNDRICDLIEAKLRSYSGYELIRLDDTTGEKDIALKDRTNKANSWGADFYLSIHHNAGVNGKSGGGVIAYVYTNVSDKTKDWQKKLYDNIIKHTGLKGNRAKPIAQANLHECRESNMPCVLLECGFMDSSTDVPIILTDDFANKVANACVEVIVAEGNLAKKIVDKIIETQVKPAAKAPETNAVKEWQNAAIKDGYGFPKYGADGKWGSECESVAKSAICKKLAIGYKNRNLTKIVQKAVGVSADGKFGKDTKAAVIKWQKLMGLSADGVVGYNTWKKILGV